MISFRKHTCCKNTTPIKNSDIFWGRIKNNVPNFPILLNWSRFTRLLNEDEVSLLLYFCKALNVNKINMRKNKTTSVV